MTHVHGKDERAVGFLAQLLRRMPHARADIRCHPGFEFDSTWAAGPVFTPSELAKASSSIRSFGTRSASRVRQL